MYVACCECDILTAAPVGLEDRTKRQDQRLITALELFFPHQSFALSHDYALGYGLTVVIVVYDNASAGSDPIRLPMWLKLGRGPLGEPETT